MVKPLTIPLKWWCFCSLVSMKRIKQNYVWIQRSKKKFLKNFNNFAMVSRLYQITKVKRWKSLSLIKLADKKNDLAFRENAKCINSVIFIIIFEIFTDEKFIRLKVYVNSGKLNKAETPRRIYLHPDAWTPATGLVTEALKLKRKNIEKAFEAEIESMYS